MRFFGEGNFKGTLACSVIICPFIRYKYHLFEGESARFFLTQEQGPTRYKESLGPTEGP